MGVSSEVATVVSDNAVPGKSLKIKICAKKPALCHKPEQVPEVMCRRTFSLTDDRKSNALASKNLKPDMRNRHVNEVHQFAKVNCLEKSSLTGRGMTSSSVQKNHNSVVGMKRKPEETLECQKGKRLKMDRRATSHCLSILIKLMKNKFSGAFLVPVNPVTCGAPDYFDIIKHPMDLGTIKRKLQQNSYIGVEEFEADVRLTFSNAMLYNPPNHWVHQHAKMLNGEFDGLWKKSAKTILFRDQPNINKSTDNCVDKTVNGAAGKHLSNSWNVDALCGNGLSNKENGCPDPKKVSVAVPLSDVKGLKDDKIKVSKQSRTNSDTAGHVSHRDKESVCPVSAKVTHENERAVKLYSKELNAAEVKNTWTLQQSRSDQDSEGAVSCMDEEHASASTAMAGSLGTTTISLAAVLNIQLSPSKALRAAKLKSRFADTIIKAQNKLQPVKGRGDDAILQEEKERLERKQREEKSRIEAQVKAAELAARIEVEGEFKRQREQARAALEKMERSTDLDDNFHTLKELEALIGSSLVAVCHNSRSCRGRDHLRRSKLVNPLERLGLYIKAEYRAGDDYDEFFLQERELEEGEVSL